MTNSEEQARMAEEANAAETPGEGAPRAADELEELRKQLGELRAQADDWLDKYRRTGADFSNYRKRQERDREQQELELRKRVLGRLVPIAEDFRRALLHMPSDPTDVQWAQGVALIASKIDSLLGEFEVTPMDAVGKPFDPNYHQALMREPSSEHAAGIVTEELEKGYLIGNQVLKPALVKVSSGSEPAS
ncbi:MAG: nucleotide exchange factor GrpE [Chloroflexi bacterium]|nr:nucleotide exchange factor GrpE [Chloroflexota bacterium]